MVRRTLHILLLLLLLAAAPVAAVQRDGYVLCHTPDHDACLWCRDECCKVRERLSWQKHLELMLGRSDVEVTDIEYQQGKVVIYFRRAN